MRDANMEANKLYVYRPVITSTFIHINILGRITRYITIYQVLSGGLKVWQESCNTEAVREEG
jgi:hypothetical protein